MNYQFTFNDWLAIFKTLYFRDISDIFNQTDRYQFLIEIIDLFIIANNQELIGILLFHKKLQYIDKFDFTSIEAILSIS